MSHEKIEYVINVVRTRTHAVMSIIVRVLMDIVSLGVACGSLNSNTSERNKRMNVRFVRCVAKIEMTALY